ncbi:MAG: leucyl aminopeptidase [bacterium]
MEIKAKQGSLTDVVCDVLIINLFEDVKIPGGATGAVNKALDNIISSYVIEKENFKGKLGKTYVLQTHGKIPADKVIIAGLGKAEDFNLNKIREVASISIKKAVSLKAKKVCTILHGAGIAGFEALDCAQMITEGAVLGAYKFSKYKSKIDDENINNINELEIIELDSSKINNINDGIKKGKIIAEATNYARDLINEPASVVTPAKLAEEAMSIQGVKCGIIEREEAERLGMGAYLAVAKGSSEPPKFIHILYKPQNKTKKRIALVGKGITFDSGGLNIKQASGMALMKGDMSGAAAVIGIMRALSELKPDVEVHGIIPACENMPGGSSYKPGDILTAMNDKTIEIDNTDAEGRLILADALSYAADLKVDQIIDIATLTGACMVALGRMAAGVMGNNQELTDNLIKSAKKGGERLWQLPLYEEYMKTLKSEIADFKNAGSREAGASVAGVFLKEFVSDVPWAHIDIAGPAWIDKDIKELSKGPTGAGVRTIINYLLSI